jgi:Uma2 family endonuclease
MMSQVIEVVERYILPDLPDSSQLPEEDGVPMETNWHRSQMNLLIDVVRHRWRDRQDFFAGGNMFVYYSMNQVRNRDYKGPDFFVVKDIDGSYPRQKWVVWEEDAHFPNVIVELMSESTKDEDLGPKKRLYERIFKMPDYFCYDPDEQQLYGWHLVGQRYVPLEPDENGRLWSGELDAWLGLWHGRFLEEEGVWLRLFDEDGRLIPTTAEAEHQRAETEHQRAETERQRADKAEAELEQLRAELARLQNRQG